MSESFFKIENTSLDLQSIEKTIEERIAKKQKNGIYDNFNTLNGEGYDFLKISNNREFIDYYLNVIKRSWEIDVNDFEIPRKKGIKGKLELILKKIIWKCLKFYTYRIFTQQIEFNSQIKNTVAGIHAEFTPRIKQLEEEIALLKSKKIL